MSASTTFRVVVKPLALGLHQVRPGERNQWGLAFHGTRGQSCLLQCSQDLAHWQDLFAFALTNPVMALNPQMSNMLDRQFFRVVNTTQK